MSVFKRLFDASYRRARSLEAHGDYRGAAALYAESGALDAAVSALLFWGEHATTAEEKREAFTSALRWLPEKDPRRVRVEGEIASATVRSIPKGPLSGDERTRLVDAAKKLEAAERYAEAIEGFELVADTESVARCLERSGDVEKLETYLASQMKSASSTREVSTSVSAYEEAMRLGARVEARDALDRASRASPDDAHVRELLAKLDARFPPRHQVQLRVAGVRVTCVGRFPAVIGRDADVSAGGTSVSRRHCELTLHGGVLRVRDLESRNGTLIGGVAIAGTIELSGQTRIGLGDDVALTVGVEGDVVWLAVHGGPDRDLRAYVSTREIVVPGVKSGLSFVDGRATARATDGAVLQLHGVRVTMPVTLLRGDVLEVDGVRVEVL